MGQWIGSELFQIMACRLWRQAIIWTNAELLSIGPSATAFNETLIEIHTFSFKKIYLKMSSRKCRPFCLGLNVLNVPIGCLAWYREIQFKQGGHKIHIFNLSLRWRHNELDGVSNHQPHDYLLNRLFGHRSKKTSKLRVTGLCARNSPGTGEFPRTNGQ